jgi:hypothetical protein
MVPEPDGGIGVGDGVVGGGELVPLAFTLKSAVEEKLLSVVPALARTLQKCRPAPRVRLTAQEVWPPLPSGIRFDCASRLAKLESVETWKRYVGASPPERAEFKTVSVGWLSATVDPDRGSAMIGGVNV